MVWFYVTDRMRRRISSVQLYPVKHCTELKLGVLTAFIHRETWPALRVWSERLHTPCFCTIFPEQRTSLWIGLWTVSVHGPFIMPKSQNNHRKMRLHKS